jgi:magnesium transporter
VGVTPVHTRCYRKGVLEEEDFPLEHVSEHLEDPETVLWVDCPQDEQLLTVLAGELDLHELAVEDALESHERPKLDHYTSHLFLSTHAVTVAPDRSGLVVQEIDVFVGPRWLVTVRNDEAFSMQPVLERWDRSSDLAAAGVS